MKILCAVDFSEASRSAARAAAILTRALGAELCIVHGAHLPGVASGTAAVQLQLAPDELQRRRVLLETLASQLGVPAAQVLRDGLPDEVVLATARELRADLIVIGAIGDRAHGEWSLGSVALRVIKGAQVPVFVVREEASLERWALGRGALRVMVGDSGRRESRPALEWLAQLKRGGPLEVSLGHVYVPGEERRVSAIEQHERALSAELARWFESERELAAPRVRVLGGFGRVAEHLLDLAAADGAELLIVGSQHRRGWSRWVHGSVSLDIVASARRNCVAVPIEERPPLALEAPHVRRVLVPVDFSPLSERAVRWALALVPDQGTLHLVHVVAPFVAAATEFGTYVPLPAPTPEERQRERSELDRRMRALVPDTARARGVELSVEVLEGFDPASQIAAAAQRAHADLVCLSTHGRSGLSRALLGSVAHGVVRHSSVPVLIVPPTERSRP